MKAHTNDLKNTIKRIGRIFTSRITYTQDNRERVLGMVDINSITPHYKSSILKTAMKQLDIDCNVEIPVGTIINYKFGVYVNGSFEFLNYGNYIVYSVEKQEDLRSYKITCYDKMLYSMKEYEAMNITYPITIRNYINAICTHLGLNFANVNDTFSNYNREIQSELYLDSEGNSLDYTFRDVLDELAQVTASTICINEETDELEIRYITNTNDTIDEEFFKNINVNFKEKYGPINSIVLSRAGGSDNVYLQDETSIEQNGLCEIKITDNQIMNWNDRSDYLPSILARLNGLEYYLNDFSSTGIFYYNMCDKYYASVNNTIYTCIMFNDEVNITQGAEEIVFTDMPEESETDYTKSDKTDRKINQTYIIVDKQNQTITSLANEVGTYSDRITNVEQTVDTISQQVSDLENLKRDNTGTSVLHLENAYPSNILKLTITKPFSLLFPQDSLNPTNNIYPIDSYLIVDKTRTLSNEARKYLLPVKQLNNGEEIVIEGGRIKVIHEDNTETDLGEFNIELFEGDNYIYLESFKENNIDYYGEYAIKSDYTDIFATKVDMNSSITQTANDINLEVSKKLDKTEVISTINQSAEQITLKSNRLVVESDGFNLDGEGNMSATSGEIGGFILGQISFTGNINGIYDYNDFDRMLCLASILNASNLDSINKNILDATGDEELNTADLTKINRIVNGSIENDKSIKGVVEINSNNPKNCLSIKDEFGQYAVQIGLGGINTQEILARNLICGDENNLSGSDPTYIIINGPDGKAYFKGATTGNTRETLIEKNSIKTNDLTVYGTFNNSSDKNLKENIIKLKDNCTKIINEINPVSYVFKNDKEKKTHYGFIAQEVEKIFKQNNMQSPTEIKDKIYTLDYLSLIAILWKDNQILHKEIDNLKEMINNGL